MRRYKIIEGGYLLQIGEGDGGIEIDEAEYGRIMEAVAACPEAPAGYSYRLKENLTWEAVELPPEPVPEPSPEDEIPEDEALRIILGGDS